MILPRPQTAEIWALIARRRHGSAVVWFLDQVQRVERPGYDVDVLANGAITGFRHVVRVNEVWQWGAVPGLLSDSLLDRGQR